MILLQAGDCAARSARQWRAYNSRG